MYNKRLVTLDFVFPARDLMTRELEMRPMDDGEKLTWTGSSFCQYNTQITFRWWLTHNNTNVMKLCWSIIQTNLGLKSSLRMLWASTMWAKHGLYLEPKKKKIFVYSSIQGWLIQGKRHRWDGDLLACALDCGLEFPGLSVC